MTVRPDVSALNDETLLAAFSLGDLDAATAFVRRFQRRVYGLAIRLLGDNAAADEVAHQAFVRAWQHGGNFDPRRASVTTWLLTITRNLAVDELRKRRADPIPPEELASLERFTSDRAPDERAVQSDELRRVTDALRGLPPEQRRAVLLASWYGQTTTEISALEHIPIGTAKTRLRNGLLRVRAALVDEESRS